LLDNPLLKEPLRPDHIKPRLLGHWGTTPGLNFVYAHLNRAIAQPISMSFIYAAPGTAGRAWSPTLISKAPTRRSTRTLRATATA
jgi:xylulose-5-phosphate/fructose-6-phosphate phosphoketolase